MNRLLRTFVPIRRLMSNSSGSSTPKSPKIPKDSKKKASSPAPPAVSASTTTKTSSSGMRTEPNKAAGNEYLVPEYFQHNKDTYAELFVQMQKQRLLRPVRPGRY